MINSVILEELEEIILTDCAESLGVSLDVVAEDFAKFNAEIDRLIEEEGLSENDAIGKVYKTWEFPKAI